MIKYILLAIAVVIVIAGISWFLGRKASVGNMGSAELLEKMIAQEYANQSQVKITMSSLGPEDQRQVKLIMRCQAAMQALDASIPDWRTVVVHREQYQQVLEPVLDGTNYVLVLIDSVGNVRSGPDRAVFGLMDPHSSGAIEMAIATLGGKVLITSPYSLDYVRELMINTYGSADLSSPPK